jgi:4'-phosphopantetheinyl transferase
MSPSEVWWLQQTESDVPQADGWLSAAESDRATGFRVPKRRRDWLLGRWTAKRAVALYLALPQDLRSLVLIEVRPAVSGAPEVFIGDRPAELVISLSHREGVAMCAVAASGTQLGCDLELVEPHSEAFVNDYFTLEERALLEGSHERDRMVALIWSAKESALKALRTGLREDTRSVSASVLEEASCNGGWGRLSVQTRTDGALQGWWQRSGQLVRTLIAEPAGPLPIALL